MIDMQTIRSRHDHNLQFRERQHVGDVGKGIPPLAQQRKTPRVGITHSHEIEHARFGKCSNLVYCHVPKPCYADIVHPGDESPIQPGPRTMDWP